MITCPRGQVRLPMPRRPCPRDGGSENAVAGEGMTLRAEPESAATMSSVALEVGRRQLALDHESGSIILDRDDQVLPPTRSPSRATC